MTAEHLETIPVEATFRQCLDIVIAILDEMATNYCGELTHKQAKRFHMAADKLGNLAAELADFRCRTARTKRP